jgi:GNAT superfamily N-acetyltransferase
MGSSLQISRLDAAEDAEMTLWHATYARAHSYGLTHPSPWMKEEMRATFLGDQVGERSEPFAGYVDGRLVVTGILTSPLKDNRHLAFVDVATDPDHRRAGHGTAMLDHLGELASLDGRDTLMADAAWPFEGAPDGAGVGNAEFLTRMGFAFSLGDIKRALHLPVDPVLLERLVAETEPRHTGYELRSFRGPVPDDIIDSLGALIGTLVTEAPMGDLDVEPEVYDAERLRADEKVVEAAGRRAYLTVAIGPDGDVVAYSELRVPGHEPDRVYQLGTLVRPEHRGRALGLATKVHNLRQLQAAEPDRRTVYTYNAEVNAHMVRVNDALGFRPVERLGEFQKKL